MVPSSYYIPAVLIAAMNNNEVWAIKTQLEQSL